MSKADIIVANYATKTDLTNRLSYDSGVKNMVDVESTNTRMNIKFENKTGKSQLIYFVPTSLLGVNYYAFADVVTSVSLFQDLLAKLGLPKGIPFFVDGYEEAAGGKLSVESLDDAQVLEFLGSSLSQTPIQIKEIGFRSYLNDLTPEDSNYGNAILRFNVNAYREKKRYNPIQLTKFQSSKDFSTQFMKINLLANNIPVVISQEDLMAVKINNGTTLEVLMEIGARDSRTELFHRDVANGTLMLTSEFTTKAVDNCKC